MASVAATSNFDFAADYVAPSSTSSSSQARAPLFPPEFQKVETVIVDGLVALKVVKHCKESLPAKVTGNLLGLEFDGKVEVTNSFPMPASDESDDNSNYQLEMLKAMRSLNQDYVTVGWYLTASFDSFINSTTVQIQYQQQVETRNAVLLVHDPFRTSEGHLALRAYRLTDAFLEFYHQGHFSHQHYLEAGLLLSDIFEEIPLSIHNSHLIHAFLFELREAPTAAALSSICDTEFERLALGGNFTLTKTLSLLSDSIEEFTKDQTAFSQYLRNASRQSAQQQAYLAKRKADNILRVSNGEKPIDEDLSKNSLFRPLPAPSRTDRMLLNQQMNRYCASIGSSATSALPKLFTLDALAHDGASSFSASGVDDEKSSK